MNIILRIGPYNSMFLGDGPIGYVKNPNLFTPLIKREMHSTQWARKWTFGILATFEISKMSWQFQK